MATIRDTRDKMLQIVPKIVLHLLLILINYLDDEK